MRYNLYGFRKSRLNIAKDTCIFDASGLTVVIQRNATGQ